MSDSSHAERNLPSRPRRRWLLRLALAAAAGIVAVAVTWLLLPKPGHTVRTQLLVPPPRSFLPRAGEAPLDLVAHQRHQIALLKSRLVLNSALRDPDVTQLALLEHHPEPVEWLWKQVQAGFGDSSEVLVISMTGPDAEPLIVLVNAIRKAYLREVVDRERTNRIERKNHVQDLMRKYHEQVKEAHRLQKELEEKAGGRDVGIRARILAFVQQQLAMSEGEMLRIQKELLGVNSALEELRGRQASKEVKIAESDLTAALEREPAILDLNAEIRTLEQNITQRLKRAAKKEKEPGVIRDRRAIRFLNKKVREVSEEMRPKLLGLLRERARLQIDQEINIKAARAASLTRTLTDLSAEVDVLRKKVSDMSRNSRKLDLAREDIRHVEDMYKRLKFEHEALNVELQAPSQVLLLEEATVLKADSQTRRMILAAGGGLGVFFFVLLGVSWLEYRARRGGQEGLWAASGL